MKALQLELDNSLLYGGKDTKYEFLKSSFNRVQSIAVSVSGEFRLLYPSWIVKAEPACSDFRNNFE